MDRKKKKWLILGGSIGIAILGIVVFFVYRANKTVPYVARSYSQVYEMVKPSISLFDWLGFGGAEYHDRMYGDVVNSNELDKTTAAESKAENYSDTNVQVEGIGEADIIKTDGEYLYLLTKNMVRIVKVNDVSAQEMSKITIPNCIFLDMYLEENKLFLISEKEDDKYDFSRNELKNTNGYLRTTYVTSYNILNRHNPKEIATLTQDGAYETSRLTDGYLYLFTRRDVVQSYLDKDKMETYIPSVNHKYLEPDCIMLPEEIEPDAFWVLSSFEVKNPEKLVDTKAILTNSSTYYVSDKHIYSAGYSYDSAKSELIKMAYIKGRFSFVARENINGSVKDSFCMDEYKENLRIVVTEQYKRSGGTKNHLYVLDENLKEIGSVKNLAKWEIIYSARFLENTAYFVTFRQMDPLYAVDLSNPKKPKVLDALKITGFSSYLHFYKDNLLLGIGKEVDPVTGDQLGVKLSMFDISNRTDIKEIDKYIIENAYDAEALENHKAVVIDAGKNLIGFSYLEEETGDALEFANLNYGVFSYDVENGFKNDYEVEFKEEFNSMNRNARGVYIGNVLYVVCLGNEDNSVAIKSYNLRTNEQITSIELRDE